MALDKHYHVWCFKCKACSTLLHGEYMGKDGQPYCEKCYQSHFGVKCSYCFRFISGKVRNNLNNNGMTIFITPGFSHRLLWHSSDFNFV